MVASARVTLIGAVAVAAVTAVALTVLIGPDPPEQPRRVSGDPALAARLVAALDGAAGVQTVEVALIEDGGARVTHAGLDQPGGSVDEHTRFEIGSVAKGLTGMLLADAADRGEVSVDARLDSIVPGLGSATLAELSTHHSGLPRLAGGPIQLVRLFGHQLAGSNPYSGTPEQVIADARSAGVPGGGEFSYSNLGAATLGQVLATALDQPYPQALQERVLRPLGLTETTVVTRPEELPANRATGIHANGRRQANWISAGYAPAGLGVWSSSADLARLVTALLAGDAPGGSAVRPRAGTDVDGERVGLGWFTTTRGGRTVTWHNGGTGGFHSFVGFDAEAGRGIVVLAATSQFVDPAALDLLIGGS